MSVLDRHIPLIDRSAVGCWPDPDMLEVGHKDAVGRPKVSKQQMTDAEYRSQFSLWCIMNAPLFISMDLRHIDDSAKKVLLNRDVIAVNQDPMGAVCRCVRSVGDIRIFVKPLAGGDTAVAFLNRGAATARLEIPAAELGLTGSPAEYRDLWTGQAGKVENGVLKADVASHAVVLLRIK